MLGVTHRYMIEIESPGEWTPLQRWEFDKEMRLALGIAIRSIKDKNASVYGGGSIHTEHLLNE